MAHPKEVANRLGTAPGKVSSILTKLAAYGRIQRTSGQAGTSVRRAAIYGVTRAKFPDKATAEIVG